MKLHLVHIMFHFVFALLSYRFKGCSIKHYLGCSTEIIKENRENEAQENHRQSVSAHDNHKLQETGIRISELDLGRIEEDTRGGQEHVQQYCNYLAIAAGAHGNVNNSAESNV